MQVHNFCDAHGDGSDKRAHLDVVVSAEEISSRHGRAVSILVPNTDIVREAC